MIRTPLSIALAAMAASGSAGAQCEAFVSPMRPVVLQLEADTAGIFTPPGGTGGPGGESIAAPTRQGEDRLIVPGGRVGAFELGATADAVRARGRIGELRTFSEPRYAHLLPAGYIPERLVAESPDGAVRFAFALADGRLSEILVRGGDYRTAEGIGVGSGQEELWRVGDLREKKSPKGASYFQGDGITFVAENGRITEIAVIRRRRPGSGR